MIALIKNAQPPHNILDHLSYLENGRKPDIYTIEKQRGDVFSECCAERSKERLLWHANCVLFIRLNAYLKYASLGGFNTTALENKMYKYHQVYYYKETQVKVNQSVNIFYTRLLFKIDAIPQDEVFLLDIAANIINNLSTDVRELLVP